MTYPPPKKMPFNALLKLAQKHSTVDCERYDCQIVTPMYCGGVHADTIDKSMPIRASSIRGHLRFWWRIVCQQNAGSTIKSFSEREQVIWGGIAGKAQASQVHIEVITEQPFKPAKPFLRGVDYALGAASADIIKNGREHECFWDAENRFVLKVRFDGSLNEEQKQQIKKEVKDAVRWWATFGGIGGRTRRGFGAIKITGLEPVTTDEVAQLGGKLCLSEPEQNADQAWRKAIHDYKAFRQGEGMGRNQGQGRLPGRSRWPEPDALRRIYRTHSTNHAPMHQAGNYFPRATFGLPIQFKFKDERIGEPKQSTLIPREKERMASPLILRPYDDQGIWRPAALLLPNWSEALAQLKHLQVNAGEKRKEVRCWPEDIAEQQETANQIPPMKKHGEVRDNHPLLAFLDFFKERK